MEVSGFGRRFQVLKGGFRFWKEVLGFGIEAACCWLPGMDGGNPPSL
jgi:hypothetical protein